MKKETKIKFTNITQNILDLFLGIPESIITAFDRKEFYKIMQSYPADQILTCSKIAQAIRNLKRSGYIEIEKKENGNESIRFTNKARLAVVDRVVARLPKEKKFHFVSFDVPEDMSVCRNKFRRAIKKMGFVPIQKSLWACDKSIGEYVEFASLEYGVEPYVVYFVSLASNVDEYTAKKLRQIQSSTNESL